MDDESTELEDLFFLRSSEDDVFYFRNIKLLSNDNNCTEIEFHFNLYLKQYSYYLQKYSWIF